MLEIIIAHHNLSPTHSNIHFVRFTPLLSIMQPSPSLRVTTLSLLKCVAHMYTYLHNSVTLT